MKFRESTVEVFTGGTFEIDGGEQTVGDLRRQLAEIDRELARWVTAHDDTLKIAEVHVHNGKIAVTLADGIWP